VRFQLHISDEALKQLRTLPREQRQRIGQKLETLQTDLQGDVKKLSSQAGRYRLRVGGYRVLFTLEKDLIMVYLVKDRKDAYRD